MSDRDDDRSRSIAVVIILALVVGAGAMIWLMGNEPEEQVPEPVVVAEPVEPVAVQEPDPEPWVEPAPEIIPAPAPEPVVAEPQPARCAFPGDGFVQTPHGFIPTEQYVAFDPPEYAGGYAGDTLPLVAGDEGEACVMLLYDISIEGRPINIRALDVQPVEVDGALYEDRAISALETRRYTPGQRNRKAVRIDNNFLEVRFTG